MKTKTVNRSKLRGGRDAAAFGAGDLPLRTRYREGPREGRMREALLIIAGGKEARGNYEEVAWHMAQLAAEALAAEGGMQ